MKNNPVYTLTEEHTDQFRTLWNGHKSHLEPSDFNYVKMKLNRDQAILTKNQVFRIVMTLTETGFEQAFPNWLLEMIDPTQSN